MEEHRSDVVVIDDDDGDGTDKSKTAPSSPLRSEQDEEAGGQHAHFSSDTDTVADLVEAWQNSPEKAELLRTLETAKTKSSADLRAANWKPPPLWVQVYVLFMRRMIVIKNDRQQTFAPLIVFFCLGLIISTCVPSYPAPSYSCEYLSNQPVDDGADPSF